MVIRDSTLYLMNSEIAILFIRSAIEHSFLKNLLPLCLLERILVLKKKNSEFLWQEFLKFDSVRKICDKIFFPEELSVSLLAEKNSRSWEKSPQFLGQEFLKMQFYPWDFQLNILSRRILHFITCWKEFLFLRKNSRFLWREFLK